MTFLASFATSSLSQESWNHVTCLLQKLLQVWTEQRKTVTMTFTLFPSLNIIIW